MCSFSPLLSFNSRESKAHRKRETREVTGPMRIFRAPNQSVAPHHITYSPYKIELGRRRIYGSPVAVDDGHMGVWTLKESRAFQMFWTSDRSGLFGSSSVGRPCSSPMRRRTLGASCLRAATIPYICFIDSLDLSICELLLRSTLSYPTPSLISSSY